MFDFLWLEPFAPFTFALALFFGLLLLEIIVGLLGGSFLGLGNDAELDIDGPDLEFGDIDIGDIDLGDVDTGDMEAFDVEGLDIVQGASSGVSTGGFLLWLGFGRVPMMIWFVSFLVGFGLSGTAVQIAWSEVLGFTLPLVIAVPAGAAIGLFFARSFGVLFAKVLPKTESSAVSERHLGRRRGVVTTGTAKRGAPAEVRVQDRFGNTQYLRAEPLKKDDAIEQGTEVLVLRATYEGQYYLIELPN